MSYFTLLNYSDLSSTQDEAKRLIHEQRWQHGLVVRAERQTQGYGSRGRSWHGGKGNLAFSLILDVEKLGISLASSSLSDLHTAGCVADAESQVLTMVYMATLALGGALLARYPNLPLEYKWVNDLLLDARKLAGTLVELIGTRALIIGMGVNAREAPHFVEQKTVSLAEFGVNLAAEEILTLLLAEFSKLLELFQQYGPQTIHARWLDRAWGRGKRCLFRDADGADFIGHLVGLSARGELLVRPENSANLVLGTGLITISAAGTLRAVLGE